MSIEDVVRAMLKAGSDVLAEEVVRQWGPVAVSTVLSWFDLSATSELGERWEKALSYKPEAVLDWLDNTKQSHFKTMALLSATIVKILLSGAELNLPSEQLNFLSEELNFPGTINHPLKQLELDGQVFLRVLAKVVDELDAF